MMPLALANVGEENLILRVGGSPELRKHLEDGRVGRSGLAMRQSTKFQIEKR